MLTSFRIGLVLVAALALGGCGTLYVAQAARGQIQILNSREPISKVLADPRTGPELRKRLEEVRAAREFAWRELGLPNNKSYTSYADLKRDYVVWSVVATQEFSVDPQEWCFPFVGCVAYRGYFRERSAQEFAARLREQGYDAIVGGVPAYSTLGKFNDPILNTMMGYGDDELASIMFHELSHQVFYVAGDTAFNEAFAVAVEQEGLARWLKFRGREGESDLYYTSFAVRSLVMLGGLSADDAESVGGYLRQQRSQKLGIIDLLNWLSAGVAVQMAGGGDPLEGPAQQHAGESAALVGAE